ncbi:AAA domain protein [Mycobacterium xenopi 4042]|uniref:AAA domain protein n=1 Tax=Mycobacterium xenopi 4042 TaxID=1299334 RepID=X8BER0_MYCXE|nr:AAA domain protein [Mycobacterium xenopi 4042]
MLHRHAGHGEAVARITWCVDQRAIGVITGEVGAGKTVAVRAATANLDPSRHVFIYLANPTIGVRGMLTHIVATLGHTPPTTNPPWPTGRRGAGQRTRRTRTQPVLVIDEAHLLDNHQLEAIRLLTNHDMDSGSPFAVILVGQPSLRHRLRLGVLAALDQRIAVRYTIAGMSGADTADYIRHHLQDCRPSRHAVLRGRDRVDPQRLPWPSPRSQQPRPARTDRRIRRRSRHRRRKGARIAISEIAAD